MQQLDPLLDQLLAARPSSFLKSDGKHQQQLDKLYRLVLEVWEPAAAAERAAKAPHFIAKAHILLRNVLSARKRSRDWKSAHYTRAVATALSVCAQAVDPDSNLDILDTVGTAAIEVAQVLSIQLAHQQQHKQQQPPSDACLQLVAFCLLRWGIAAEQVWKTYTSNSSSSFILRIVHLAAVFSRCCFEASVASPGSMYAAVVAVTELAFLILARFRRIDAAAFRGQLLCSPAAMQLCLTLLLPISCLLMQQAEGGSSSSSSSSCGGGSSGVETLAAAMPQSAAAATQQQQQQQQQHTALASQLWVAASFPAETLPLWTAAAEDLLQLGRLLNSFATPDPHLSSSAGSSTGNPDDIRQLPPNSPQLLQSFVVLSQVFALCMRAWVARSVSAGRNTYVWLKGGRELSREQQQLLQGVVWQLPQLLLQTALLCGGGEPLVTEVAADAAWCCSISWGLAELQPSIAASSAGSSSSSSSTVAAQQLDMQLLPPLLDCWLQLMQQQLLQPGGVLLSAIQAAAAADFQQQQQNQQALQGAGQAVAAAAQYRHPDCECFRQYGVPVMLVTPGDGPCVVVDCSRSYCVSVLLDLLQPLAFTLSVEGWSGQLPAVLLLLEVLLRRVGPLKLLCCINSSSGGSSSSDSSSGSSRVSSGCLLMHASCVYACQALITGKPWYNWDDEGTPASPSAGVMMGMVAQAAVQQPSPVLQRSMQQLAAVMASFLKLCRCHGQQGDISSAARAPPLEAMDVMFSWATCISQALSSHSSSLSEARAALAPWVMLLGQFLIRIAEQLLLWSAHLEPSLAAPLETTQREAINGLEWSVKLGQQLVDAVNNSTAWRKALHQSWQDSARYARATSDDSQQQTADRGRDAASSGAPAGYWLQHGDLALEFAAIEIYILEVNRSSSRSEFLLLSGCGAELHRLGAALCAKAPVPCMCNNPRCMVLSGASELQLVGGKACVCGGCRVARYCGVSCQAAHWPQHSTACRQIAAVKADVAPA